MTLFVSGRSTSPIAFCLFLLTLPITTLHSLPSLVTFVTDFPFGMLAPTKIIAKSITRYAFNLAWHIQNGQGIERGWAKLDTVVTSTREMGPGNRHDTLDDHFSYINWQRNIGLGDSLTRKLLIAREEHDDQIEGLKEIRDTVPKESVKQWIKDVEARINI